MLEMKAKLPMPRDVYEGTKENHDPSQLPLLHPDSTDTRSLRQKSASDNASMGGISVCLEEQEELENEPGSRNNFDDIPTLGADDHFPQFFKTLQDKAWGPPLQSWRVISSSSEKVMKNDLKDTDKLYGASPDKIQHQDMRGKSGLWAVQETRIKLVTTSQNIWRTKLPKCTPGRTEEVENRSKKDQVDQRTTTKKPEELKSSRNRVKVEEKPTIPKTKRKRNPLDLIQNSFKNPQTLIGRHVLDSVQVFHPLGKRREKKTGISSFRGL